LEELVKQEFGYLIPLILNVAAIEAFGFVYLCRAIQLGTDKFLGKC
jgi:hypothetical protein